jgi:peroxiredoxin
MNLRIPTCLFLSTILVSSSSLAQAPALRKSPELAITEPSGEQLLLSSFKGKVVVLEIMFVNSPHCVQLAQMLSELQSSMGSQGFQAVAVAFGPHSDQALVGHVAERLQLSYPMGSATSESVDSYLGRTGSEMLKIPQMVVIDRKGFIRAKSGTGDPTLENESSLRASIGALLKEKAPAGQSASDVTRQRIAEPDQEPVSTGARLLHSRS